MWPLTAAGAAATASWSGPVVLEYVSQLRPRTQKKMEL